jgi:hypothetical protein
LKQPQLSGQQALWPHQRLSGFWPSMIALSVFIFARTYLGIDTGWDFATGARDPTVAQLRAKRRTHHAARSGARHLALGRIRDVIAHGVLVEDRRYTAGEGTGYIRRDLEAHNRRFRHLDRRRLDADPPTRQPDHRGLRQSRNFSRISLRSIRATLLRYDGPSAVPRNVVSPPNHVLANSFAKSARPDQDFLISICCIDISPRHGEIDHPILARVRSSMQTLTRSDRGI